MCQLCQLCAERQILRTVGSSDGVVDELQAAQQDNTRETKQTHKTYNTMKKARLVMNIAPDVLLKDLAKQYVDGRMSTLEYLDAMKALADDMVKCNCTLNSVGDE